ncbi:hypothetical protein NG895_01795 [Aeoliella sp. ICT_H6.2]|uniref:Secreted protein n=1 Tax=Aeoliella straminimaris TaxID=2954799 RepID=A0A9X2JH81_9BACT|nr:hypothetical protein [Aeoliella straminimaris]MCO6042629.1 hypothetical protein [Aeoliella straminimaris]
MKCAWVLLAATLLVVSAESARAVSEQLAQAIDGTKSSFEPVTPEQVAAAREELIATAEQFEQFLDSGGERGEVWKRYLEWEGVQQSLGEPLNPALAPLAQSLNRFRSGAAGTELPQFRRVAVAMEKFIDLSTLARARDQQAFVDRQLDLLAKYLDRYAEDNSTRARFEVERRLDFFTGIGQAPELIAALRNEFNHPNFRAEISEKFLARVASDPVDNVSPVRDCILGTTIRGTGHTTGSVSLSTVPNSQQAELLLTLSGVTHSETNGYNDPVVIRSSGTTPFTATKRIALEDSNFWNYPTHVSATTSTTTRSVKKQGGGIGSRLIEAIGERQVEQKKPQANRIAARHAEDRISENMEEELLPKLQDARYEYENQFQKPLANRNAEPQMVAFSTTDSSLNFDLLQAGRGELGADAAPPAFAAGHDLAVRLHETGASNLAAVILSGATLSQQTKDGHPKLNVELPPAMRKAIDNAREEAEDEPAADDEREFKPWSLTFRRLRPITLDFKDQKIVVRIHSARIQVQDDTYDGWDIVATYGMHLQNGGLFLVRDGDIEVIPTSFDPAEGGSLNNRQVGTRGVLAKELNRQSDAGRGFPEEIEIPMIDLPEAIAEHGPLLLEDASSDAGWLQLGWQLPPR